MSADAKSDIEARILIAAPTARDAELTVSLLSRAGIVSVACPSLHALTREAAIGAAAVLLTEESLLDKAIGELLQVLNQQPAWSGLPIIMLMHGASESPVAIRVLNALGNVTLLERPAPMRSLVSAVRAAITARQRQYQIRELLDNERIARAEAERAGRMKDEFLATLSHELRTPLNAILGWSQLIRHDGEDKQMLAEGLAIIERNARVQVQLIEDLLDMSRIISGKVRLDVQPLDAASFIDAAIETVKPAAEAKAIRLQKTLDPSVQPIMGDSGRLQQVVWNLLSNAIKFTPRGGNVRVELSRVKSHVEIVVQDSGVGIKPEFLPHVFERFRQQDASTTRAHGGLGLGLAIVKHLVELHGGTVAAESAGEGHGSAFRVSLPVAAVQQHRDHVLRAQQRASKLPSFHKVTTSLNGMKVLVVDDEPDARGLIKRILEECKASVVTAGSAMEAVQLVESEKPDVLLSDIGMPTVDGHELLRRVRELGESRGGTVPAIALSAFARTEDRTRALLSGFLVHLSKPVEPGELVAAVATIGGRTGQSVAG